MGDNWAQLAGDQKNASVYKLETRVAGNYTYQSRQCTQKL